MNAGGATGLAALLTALGTFVAAIVALRRSGRAEDRDDSVAATTASTEERKVGLAEFESVTKGLRELAQEAVNAAARADDRAVKAEERAGRAEASAAAATADAAAATADAAACHRERDAQGLEIRELRAEVAALRGMG